MCNGKHWLAPNTRLELTEGPGRETAGAKRVQEMLLNKNGPCSGPLG